MQSLLDDASKFKKLNIQPGKDYNHIHNQELKIINELKSLKKRGSITKGTYDKLFPCGTVPSVMYGLSKVHKPVVNNKPKLRPILAAINSSTYNISQYLNTLLKPFVSNEFTAKDSFSFAHDIQLQKTSLYMASLDVDSLFTNIPLVETINICCDLLFRDNPIVDGLNMSEFKMLLTLATQESLILFNGSYYQQIDGVAMMGSPLGPTLANIFLCYHEESWLSKCPKEFKPSYYKRYVDDIFVLLPDSSCLEPFKVYMNKQHVNMNFTSESELDDTLPFLDVYVLRHNDQFVTSVYRKPTFSGVYTNFSSFIPMTYKISLVSTLLHRAYTICSSWKQIDSEIKQIKTLMRRNGFPLDQIDRTVSRHLNKIHNGPKEKHDETEVKKVLICLPYLGAFSKRLQSRIQKTVGQNLPSVHINFVFRSSSRLRTLFSFKDKIPLYLHSNLVYKFKCSRCNSTYVGETARHSIARFSEHLGKSALTGMSMKRIVPSAVNEHTAKCKHDATSEDFKILCKDSLGKTSLRVKESLFIHRDNPNLNDRKSSVPLVLF